MQLKESTPSLTSLTLQSTMKQLPVTLLSLGDKGLLSTLTIGDNSFDFGVLRAADQHEDGAASVQALARRVPVRALGSLARLGGSLFTVLTITLLPCMTTMISERTCTRRD
jgi:hypothetical protein